MLIGVHISVSGGYAEAVKYALSVDAECAQIFAKSPRQWRGPVADPASARDFVAKRREVGFGPVFTHAAYLLNLASSDDALWDRSVAALADELERAALVGADGVVTHLGSDKLQDAPRAAARIAQAVCKAFDHLDQQGPRPQLLLENTAGAGNSYGSTFQQLGAVIDETGLGPELLGVCLDTCHAHAFGLALDSEVGWDSVLASVAEHVGFDRFGLIHANDSMFDAGSRRDRHAWIGEGTIGFAGFAAMFQTISSHSELDSLCAIAEVSGEKPQKDEENITRLRGLRSAVG